MPEVRAIERPKLRLGETEYKLRYPLAAMKEAREEFGGPINSLATLQRVDETNLAKLIWYGLRADYPDVTVEQLEAIIDPTMFKDLMNAYMAAVSASLPDPPKNEQSPAEMIAAANQLLARAEALAKSMTSTGLQSGVSEDTTSDLQMPSSGTSHSENSAHLQNDTKAA